MFKGYFFDYVVEFKMIFLYCLIMINKKSNWELKLEWLNVWFFFLLEIDVNKNLNIMFFFVWILNVNEFVIFVICIDLYFDKFWYCICKVIIEFDFY